METEPEARTWSRRLKRLGEFAMGLGVAAIAVNLLPGLESPVVGGLGAAALLGGTGLTTVGVMSDGIPSASETPKL
jgi:hypothetical protein